MPALARSLDERNRIYDEYKARFGFLPPEVMKYASLQGLANELYDELEAALVSGQPLTNAQLMTFVGASPQSHC